MKKQTSFAVILLLVALVGVTGPAVAMPMLECSESNCFGCPPSSQCLCPGLQIVMTCGDDWAMTCPQISASTQVESGSLEALFAASAEEAQSAASGPEVVSVEETGSH